MSLCHAKESHESVTDTAVQSAVDTW